MDRINVLAMEGKYTFEQFNEDLNNGYNTFKAVKQMFPFFTDLEYKSDSAK